MTAQSYSEKTEGTAQDWETEAAGEMMTEEGFPQAA